MQKKVVASNLIPLLFNTIKSESFEGEKPRVNCKVYAVADCILRREDGSSICDGQLRYVVCAKGSLYIENLSDPVELIYHSQILAGRDVRSAGYVRIKDGKIVYIDIDSGHYKPTFMHLMMALIGLKSSGLVSPEVEATDFRSFQGH